MLDGRFRGAQRWRAIVKAVGKVGGFVCKQSAVEVRRRSVEVRESVERRWRKGERERRLKRGGRDDGGDGDGDGSSGGGDGGREEEGRER